MTTSASTSSKPRKRVVSTAASLKRGVKKATRARWLAKKERERKERSKIRVAALRVRKSSSDLFADLRPKTKDLPETKAVRIPPEEMYRAYFDQLARMANGGNLP